MKKGLFIYFLSFVLLLTSCQSFSRQEKDERPISIAFLPDLAGLEDKSINDLTQKALESLSSAENLRYEIYLSQSEDRYEKTIIDALEDKPKIVITTGYALADVFNEAAKAHPETAFLTIDNIYDQKMMPNNLYSAVIDSQQLAYLSGYFSALASQSYQVGFLEGQPGILTDSYKYGFLAGVYDAGKFRSREIHAKIETVGSDADSKKASLLGKSIFDQGADVAYSPSIKNTLGLMAAAKEKGKKLIANEASLIDLAREHFLASLRIDYDFLLEDAVMTILSGQTDKIKNKTYGFEEESLDIAIMAESDIKIQEIHSQTKKRMQEILDEKWVIPHNEKMYLNYVSAEPSEIDKDSGENN